jgi:hypothetical protein
MILRVRGDKALNPKPPTVRSLVSGLINGKYMRALVLILLVLFFFFFFFLIILIHTLPFVFTITLVGLHLFAKHAKKL